VAENEGIEGNKKPDQLARRSGWRDSRDNTALAVFVGRLYNRPAPASWLKSARWPFYSGRRMRLPTTIGNRRSWSWCDERDR